MGTTLNKLLLAAVLDGESKAMNKIAAEGEGGSQTCKVEGCGKPCSSGSSYCKDHAEQAARREEAQAGAQDSETEKTSSAHVEKLASALEYIAANFNNIGGLAGRVKIAEPAATTTPADAGPGRGVNSLKTNLDSPVPGEMPEGFGEAKSKKPDMTPGLERGATPKSAPNAMATDEKSVPGGTGEQSPTILTQAGIAAGDTVGNAGTKQASAVSRIKKAMLHKAGADDVSSASITAPKTQTVTAPEDQSPEGQRPAEVTGQEKLIASSEAAIGATKAQAKAVPKKRMGEVLTEPAQSASTDTALDKALGSDVVNQAGAKVASAQARVLLRKVASQGCTCEGQGSCGHCKIASRLERRSTEQAGALWEAARNVPGDPTRSRL